MTASAGETYSWPMASGEGARRTDSGIEIRRRYDAEDLEGFDPSLELGEPGAYPYTRGVQRDMYRGRLWTMRQYAGFGTAESTNERFKFLLEAGQTGLSCAFDLPTQMGYDSDHPRAEGEVGKVGVAIDSIEDMRGPVGRASPRQGLDLDDDQRHRRDPAPALRARGLGAGRRAVVAERHHPERHLEGVRRPRHLHLPAATVHAPCDRHLRLLRGAGPGLEHDLDLRLPHP